LLGNEEPEDFLIELAVDVKLNHHGESRRRWLRVKRKDARNVYEPSNFGMPLAKHGHAVEHGH
jgi:hypothetical protein